jgi:hypothetical protein
MWDNVVILAPSESALQALMRSHDSGKTRLRLLINFGTQSRNSRAYNYFFHGTLVSLRTTALPSHDSGKTRLRLLINFGTQSRDSLAYNYFLHGTLVSLRTTAFTLVSNTVQTGPFYSCVSSDSLNNLRSITGHAVLRALTMHSIVWKVTPCSPVKSTDVSEEYTGSKFRIETVEHSLQRISCWFLDRPTLLPWRCRQYVPQKLWIRWTAWRVLFVIS